MKSYEFESTEGIWSPGTGGSGGGGSPRGLSGVQTNNGAGGFSGQSGIYSTLYNGGSEYQEAQNCLNLTAGSLPVQLCGVTLQ